MLNSQHFSITLSVLILLLHYLDVHKQISPWFRNADLTRVCTTFSTSASWKTMAAFLPPNSRLSFFIMGAANPAIRWPTAVLPVNEMILEDITLVSLDAGASTEGSLRQALTVFYIYIYIYIRRL